MKFSFKKLHIVTIVILLSSIFCNLFLFLIISKNNASISITGTYQVSDEPIKTEYLSIAKEDNKKYIVYSYIQGEDYVEGELTKLNKNIYKMYLHDNNDEFYLVFSKKKVDLIIEDNVISYNKVSDNLEFIGKKFK